eukprot:1904805-Alexandrium_andersonii.AAC.1
MLEPECMHCLHLGVVQWANGNVLLWLVGMGYFGVHEAGGRKDNLDRLLCIAFAQFKQWAGENGVRHSERLFTAGKLGCTDNNDWPLLKSKAHNGKCVLLWLAFVVHDQMQYRGAEAQPAPIV